MTKLATMIIAASVALTASTTALAADTTATLHVDRGSIMSSEGGEFTSVRTGELLVEGERLMVTEDSAATVKYSNGCVREYTVPGVYVVEANCVPAAAIARGGATTNLTAASAVLSGVGVGALLLGKLPQGCKPEKSHGTGRPGHPGCSPISR